MKSAAKFLVLAGDGINCERETAAAFERAGVAGEIVHINDLVKNPGRLKKYQGLALPGGFSFGDELGSGRILALKLECRVGEELNAFVEDKKPIIGICNGFQVLAKLGLLPFQSREKVLALAANREGLFIDSWPELTVHSESVCKWTKNVPKTIRLPIRHGEGRVVFREGREEDIYRRLQERGQLALSYRENPNGSYQSIAGLCDESGLILGLMPHPEGAVNKTLGPELYKNVFAEGDGLGLFKSIVEYLES